MKNAVTALAFLFWASMWGWLYVREIHPRAAESDRAQSFREVLADLEEEKSYRLGVWFQGQRLGYSETSMKPLGDGSFEIVNTSYFKFLEGAAVRKVMGIRNDAGLEAGARTALEISPDFRLRAIESRVKVGDSTMSLEGQVRHRKLFLSVTGPDGVRQARTVDLSEGGLMRGGLFSLGPVGKPRPGATWRFSWVDPMGSSRRSVTLRVADRETRTYMGRAVDVYRVVSVDRKLKLEAWVDEKGELMEQNGPFGLRFLREPAGVPRVRRRGGKKR